MTSSSKLFSVNKTSANGSEVRFFTENRENNLKAEYLVNGCDNIIAALFYFLVCIS